MSKVLVKKILQHPDKDEILSKICIGISSKDIHDWLASKYTNVSEAKFVIAEKNIKLFKDNYLDIYSLIQEDLSKTRTAIVNNSQDDLQLTLKGNSAYKDLLLKSAGEELDVRKIVKGMCSVVENRISQIYDEIQADPQNINTRVDRLFIEYVEALGNLLDKAYKFTEVPVNQVINNNITLQVVDQHISVFHEVIREILSQMDLETSLYFMEVFNEKMAKLKAPEKEHGVNSDIRLAEAKLLNETINKKIN